ncbi:MAG: DNA primase [Desulfuromonadales bacterium]|nr:DNA primase [Desulfuromonadales bacterium]
MTGQIGDDKIHEVRERMDIVELVSGYVSLKRSGANHMGLCPFHAEKSPSFSVNAGRQFFHCFGCGTGGDVFAFLMKMEGLAFPDAVRRLAERVGVELEERRLSPEEQRLSEERERLFRVNEIAAGYFHRLLMEDGAGEAARQYLKQRGYGRKAAGEYQIGFASEGWEGLTRYLETEGVNLQDARTLGLIRPRKEGRGDYDLFRRRLIFPIANLAGRVVAFGGRVLDDSKPKYINSPESPIYHKGRILFGLFQARQAMRQAGEAILVEGYFDQLALNRSGFMNAVATCGTALTAEHATLLKRYVQRVLLLFDQDAAGRKATFRAMEALQSEGVPTAVVDLAAGEDPDSFLQREGADLFRQRMEQARPAMELFLEKTLADAGGSIEGKARAAEVVVATLTQLPSELEQDLYLKALAAQTGIALALLQQKLVGARERARSAERKSARRVTERSNLPPHRPAAEIPLPEMPPEEPGATAETPRSPSWGKAEGQLFSLLMLVPEARELIRAQGVADYFQGEQAREIASQLLAMPSDIAEGEEAAWLLPFPEEVQQRLAPLLNVDRAAFADSYERQLQDCRRAAVREKLQRRKAELRELIASADGDDKIELMQEFTRLKKQLN